jgi:Short C-terminal domain
MSTPSIHPKRVMPPGRGHAKLGTTNRNEKGASMFVRRRRPLARAAMVGGAAYYAGKKGQQASERESEQEARLQDLEAQQYAQPQQQYAPPAPAPPPPAPSAGGITDETMAQLQKLGQLKEQGILTQEEFDAQKAKLLGLS